MGAFGFWQARVAGGARELARDETLRLPRRRGGVVLRVASGCLLVTREGDHEDHVLLAGEELRLTGRGLAVAWALEPSTVLVDDAPVAAARGAQAARLTAPLGG
jgi:hypothetical protein